MLSGDGFFEPRVPQPPIRTRPQLHHPTSIYFRYTGWYFHLLPFTSSVLPFTCMKLIPSYKAMHGKQMGRVGNSVGC